MNDLLSIEDIEALCDECRALIGNVTTQHDAGAPVQQLDASILLDILAWRVVVPILVSVTGGVTAYALKERLAAAKSRAEAETEARSFVGARQRSIEATEYEKCVSTVTTIVLPFGIRREKAEVIVQRLLRRTSDPPGSNQCPAISQPPVALAQYFFIRPRRRCAEPPTQRL